MGIREIIETLPPFEPRVDLTPRSCPYFTSSVISYLVMAVLKAGPQDRGGTWNPRRVGGVYPGMFEQSIVLEPHTGRKIGAVAGSIGAQILAVGVLIVVPLLYN